MSTPDLDPFTASGTTAEECARRFLHAVPWGVPSGLAAVNEWLSEGHTLDLCDFVLALPEPWRGKVKFAVRLAGGAP